MFVCLSPHWSATYTQGCVCPWYLAIGPVNKNKENILNDYHFPRKRDKIQGPVENFRWKLEASMDLPGENRAKKTEIVSVSVLPHPP